jgi:hypothetical protein
MPCVAFQPRLGQARLENMRRLISRCSPSYPNNLVRS